MGVWPGKSPGSRHRPLNGRDGLLGDWACASDMRDQSQPRFARVALEEGHEDGEAEGAAELPTTEFSPVASAIS